MRTFLLAIASLVVVWSGPAAAQPPTPRQAEAYYEFLLGRSLENDGEIEAAIAAHQRAARLDPTSADLPAELAAVYARQGRFDEARAAAEAAIALDADNLEANRVLGSVFAALVDSESKNPEIISPDEASRRAIEHLERARRREGANLDPGVDLTLGRLYLHAGKPEEAARVLRRLLEYQPDVAEASVLLARAETALGRPDRAVEALEDAASGSPRLLASLAELYERQQRWTEAAATYERLAQMNPGSTDMRVRWASALLQTEAPEAFEQARGLLRTVVAAAPTDTRALYLLSTAERRTRDFPAAEATARRLIAAAPDGPTGPFALAQVFEDQRLFARAADVLAPAVDRLSAAAEPPRELLTLVAHLGYAELQAGRAAAAIATFERARALSGGAAFDTALVQAHLLARQYDKAADLARAARQRRPDDLRLAQLEARALARAGKGDRAVVVMRDALAAHDDDVEAHLTLAEVLQEARRAGEADEVLSQAATRFPSEISVPFQRGALLEQRKDYTGAEAAFREALARDPLHAPSLNYLGYMLAERGERLDEAVALVERALAIDPDNGAYLDSLGWAFFKQKRFDKAEPLLRRAAEQAPANSVVQEHYGDVLWAAGKRLEAVAAWKQALGGDRESIDPKAVEAKIARAR